MYLNPQLQACASCSDLLRGPTPQNNATGLLKPGVITITIHRVGTDKDKPNSYHETKRYCRKCAQVAEDLLRSFGFEIIEPYRPPPTFKERLIAGMNEIKERLKGNFPQ